MTAFRSVPFALAVGLAALLTAPPHGLAQTDKDLIDALNECKKIANPQEKDDCVSNAENRYGRGQGGDKEKQQDGQGKKGDKSKNGDKGDKADKSKKSDKGKKDKKKKN